MIPYFLAIFATLKFIKPIALFYLLLAAAATFLLWRPAATAATAATQPSSSSASAATTLSQQLDFLQKMEPERFRQIVKKEAEFNRIYMYILGERRPCHAGISDLHKARTETIELMESSILNFPQRFRHIYGRDPDRELENAVEEFRLTTRQKLETIHRFCHDRHPDIPYRSEVIMPAPQPSQR